MVFEPIRPQKREVVAAQDRLGDAQVERVVVGQHEEERAGRRVRDLALGAVSTDVRRMCAGQGEPSVVVGGKPSSRSSIQSTATSSVASSVAIARPTWPAPCSCR